MGRKGRSRQKAPVCLSLETRATGCLVGELLAQVVGAQLGG